MNEKESQGNRLATKTPPGPLWIKLGYWSALVCSATFVVFTICFIVIALTNPLFTWTNLQDSLAYETQHNQFFKYLAQFAMLVFGVSNVVLLSGIAEFAASDRKILARIGSYFGIAFAATIGINYFLQITAVRLGILKGQTQGLEQFIQSNPVSGVAAVNMLGWTVFFALSSLFVAPIFTGGRLEKVIRYAFMINGIICLLGGVGYVFDLVMLVFFCMNLGMGAAVLVAMISLCLMFKRKAREWATA